MNSTLVNRLSGDAGGRVHVQVADGVGVGVGDPGHLSLAGAHVWKKSEASISTVNIDVGSCQLKLDPHVLLLFYFLFQQWNAQIYSRLNDTIMHFYGLNWDGKRGSTVATA